MRAVLMMLSGLAAVHTTACAPTCEPTGIAYCEGDVLTECTGDGTKGVVEKTDCAAAGEVCANNGGQYATPMAACRPADCAEGWACFSDNLDEQMCDLAGENVFVCIDEGDGCFGWEFVTECDALGPGLTCVEQEEPGYATCE